MAIFISRNRSISLTLFLLFAFFFLTLQDGTTAELFTEIQKGPADIPVCSVVYEKVGCYEDNLKNRTLPMMLITDRDPHSDYYSEQPFNWSAPFESMTSLACRCAVAAFHSSFNYFGLQFYAECWSGVPQRDIYKQNASSERCVDSTYNSCKTSSTICVGQDSTNFVYRIVQPSCKDDYPICKHYASMKLCTEEYPLVLEFCRKSCKLC